MDDNEQAVKIKYMDNELKKKLTITQFRKALKDLRQSLGNFISQPGNRRRTGRIKLSESDLKDRIYIDYTPGIANMAGSGDLVISNLEVEIEKNSDVDNPLIFRRAMYRVLNPYFSSVEIKGCKFVCGRECTALGPLIFDFRMFKKVKFIRNEFPRLNAVIKVFDHLKTDSVRMNVEDNLLFKLAIKYAAFANKPNSFSYAKSVIKGNYIFSSIDIQISPSSLGELKFSLSDNITKELILRYPYIKEAAKTSKKTPKSPQLNGVAQKQELDDNYPGRHKLIMGSGNVIDVINMEGKYPEIVSWVVSDNIGAGILEECRKLHQEDSAKEKVEVNRALFNFFRKIAIDKHKKILEQVMIYNIAKMDRIQLNIDNWPWWDRFIYLVGWHLSEHGTSWILPLRWILRTSLWSSYIFALLLYGQLSVNIEKLSAGSISSYLKIFLFSLSELIDPFGSPRVILWRPEEILSKAPDLEAVVQSGFSVVIIGVIFFLFKAFYAICIYEFVRAARRFTLK